MPYALRPAVKKELKKMEDEGIIEPWKFVIGPHPLSVYLRRMAQYAYVAAIRGLSITPFKRSSFLFRR